MTEKLLVTYTDTNNSEVSIEGFVDTEKDFDLWLKSHNKKRVREGHEAESKSSFKLIKIFKMVEVIKKRFKKGETTPEVFKVLMHDLQSLNLTKDESNKYHYNLLMKNLSDLFGNLDYCESCEEYIYQIEVEEGVFGCPLCKSSNQITTFYEDGDN